MRILILLLIFVAGCTSLLPSETANRAKARSYDTVKAKYDRIEVNRTTYQDVVGMGFDPYEKDNVTLLKYTDMIVQFMPSDNVTFDNLPDGIRMCIEAKGKCTPYLVEYSNSKKERIGNTLLDVFGFVKETETIGWSFTALIVVVDDVIVYKLSEGEPNYYNYQKRVRPLGPLQSMGSSLIDK